MSNRGNEYFQSLGIKIPIIQAPMAGATTPEMVIAVSNAGGLGSLPCALLSVNAVREAWAKIRAACSLPVNLNFFCHTDEPDDPAKQERWKNRLAGYYAGLGLDINTPKVSASRAPFNDEFCSLVEELKPPVVSFHFGLPAADLLTRVKNTGALMFSSATTVEEAKWLEQNGCDVIIAQGAEAGGHRGMFLSEDITLQTDMEDLLKEIINSVNIPVVAAGGIADGSDIKKAIGMGASAVQVGTAFLFCKEANISPLHLQALKGDHATAITNVFTGKPARSIINRLVKETGPMSADAPVFPYAATLVVPLRQAAEKSGSGDFIPMWSGTRRIPHSLDAATLTTTLYEEFRNTL